MAALPKGSQRLQRPIKSKIEVVKSTKKQIPQLLGDQEDEDVKEPPLKKLQLQDQETECDFGYSPVVE